MISKGRLESEKREEEKECFCSNYSNVVDDCIIFIRITLDDMQ